jgi:hypothetical protein
VRARALAPHLSPTKQPRRKDATEDAHHERARRPRAGRPTTTAS